ncbi:hypothetical protein ACS0TY_021393 [Phlomoides rotata]
MRWKAAPRKRRGQRSQRMQSLSGLEVRHIPAAMIGIEHIIAIGVFYSGEADVL